MSNSVPYLERLSSQAASRHDISEIRAAINSAGFWERQDEWRIFTNTSKRIEPVEHLGRKYFRVTAKCDHEFTCHSLTLERAIEILGIYDQLIMDLFWTVGWPSWAKKTQQET